MSRHTLLVAASSLLPGRRASRSVSRPPSLLAMLAAASLLLAGCSFAPGGPSTATSRPPPDIEVSFANSANSTDATYDMEVLLLPQPVDRARVTYTDGSTEEVGNLSAVDGVGVYGPTDGDEIGIRAVEPRDVEPVDTRIYRGVGPRSSVSSTFEDPPRNASLFVVVSGSEGVYLWATGTCGENDHLNAFGVELRDVGPGVSVGCEAVDVGTR